MVAMPEGALAAMVTVALIWVSVELVMAEPVTPLPVTVSVGAVPNPDPVIVKDVCAPAGQLLGLTPVITGVGSPTWKLAEPDPKQVVSVSVWLPVLALSAKRAGCC